MPDYIYNTSKTDGKYHEVHTTLCRYLPYSWNRESLGCHSSCKEAIKEAESRTGDRDFDGCYHCSRDCHHG